MVKVITFNLRCCDDANGHSIDERAPRVKAILDRCDADLIGFQEATPRWLEHLNADYGEEYEIFNKYRTKQNVESTPMMWRKSRFECLEKGYFWFSNTPDIESQGWDSWGCYRICLWAKLRDKVEGVEFVFFNTHYGFGDDCQTKSGQLILDHIAALEAGAALVTADFNMTSDSAGYKVLTSELIECNAETLNYTGPTFHGYHPEGRKGAPIDFCFATPGTVTPLKAVLLDDCFDGKYPSDHFGVYYEVEIRNRRSVCAVDLACASADASVEHDRMSKVATWIRSNDVQLAIVRNEHPTLALKMSRRGFEGVGGIYWRPEFYELAEEVEGAVVLKSCCSGKKLVVAADGQARESLPTIMALFDLPYLSEKYNTCARGYADLRAVMEKASESDHLFYYGEEMKPLACCLQKVEHQACSLADRPAIIAEFLLSF